LCPELGIAIVRGWMWSLRGKKLGSRLRKKAIMVEGEDIGAAIDCRESVYFWLEARRRSHRPASDATSDSRYRPGIIYVNERKPDSICDTALAFFEMKSP